MQCPSCGQENPPAARFCFSCGTSLAEAAAREERKVVTVLFADLVGFTSRAEQMDPEDVRALLAPYHRRLRGELERFGGTVEKFIGDAVVALFGAPVAHEDDPERAVRAALAIRDWVRAEEEDLQLRIAVNTGEALIALGARPEAGEGMASGDVVNTAARLQSAAPVNGILVGEATWRATRDRIEFAEHEAVSAKGKAAPIPVWEAVQAKSRLGMDLEQRVLTPLIGRERELGAVLDAFDRASREREPQLVTLVGVPGIGKSRLVSELFQRITDMPELVWWRQGRALPYGSGVSFWAIGEIVKAQAGINENDPPDAAAEKLRVSVEQTVEEHECEWARRHLETLLGLSDVGALDRQEAFVAWRRYFEGLAEQGPLVLVFEDLHWADDGLLDFVDHLAEWAVGVPMLILASARPELLDRRPNWGGGKLNAVTLALSPLGDADAARVIAAVLEQTVLPAETQATLLEQAGGNPLYAEQFARLYLEHGSADGMRVPENVQGIIAARLDALPDREKQLLQDAAVLGKVFWSGGVASDDLTTALHALERKGFIRRERRSAVAGEDEYAFRHVLVREVAYGQIPRMARGDKHVVAADWIESLGRPEDHAELIAHHYEAALALSAASGGKPTGELVESARLAFRRAAERAAKLNAFTSAADYFAAALKYWPQEDAGRGALEYGLARAEYMAGRNDGRPLTEVAERLATEDVELAATAFTLAGEAAWHRGQGAERDRCLRRAHELVEPLPASSAKAWVISHASRQAMLESRNLEAIELGELALEMADRLGLPEIRAHALNNIGTARVTAGDDDGLRMLEESIRISEQLNSPEVCRGYNNLAAAYYVTGELQAQLEAGLRTIEAAERFGLSPVLRFARATLPGLLLRLGRWDEGLERADAVLAVEAADSMAAVSVTEPRAWLLAMRDDLSTALADSEHAFALSQRMSEPQSVYPAAAIRAFVLHEAGEDDAARRLLLDRFHGYEQAGIAYGMPADGVVVWLELFGSEVWRQHFDAPDARQTPWLAAARALVDDDFDRAIEIYAGTGAVTDVARAQLRAAQQLSAEGRRAEAAPYLDAALAFYRSVGAKRRVRQAESLLAATA